MKKRKAKLSDIDLLRKVTKPLPKGLKLPRPAVRVRRGFSRR